MVLFDNPRYNNPIHLVFFYFFGNLAAKSTPQTDCRAPQTIPEPSLPFGLGVCDPSEDIVSTKGGTGSTTMPIGGLFQTPVTSIERFSRDDGEISFLVLMKRNTDVSLSLPSSVVGGTF